MRFIDCLCKGEYLPQELWGFTGPGAPQYHILTNYGLRKACEENGISGYSEMTREEMLERLDRRYEDEWNRLHPGKIWKHI